MDIRNWPMDRIMQLPDNAFGQRWIVSVAARGKVVGANYDISEMALPERCVVWTVFFLASVSSGMVNDITLSMGDKLPASDAEFDVLEPLMRDLGYYDGTRRYIELYSRTSVVVLPMRKLIHSVGRRLVGRLTFEALSTTPTYAGLVVSSIPTEVPDCLLSVHP